LETEIMHASSTSASAQGGALKRPALVALAALALVISSWSSSTMAAETLACPVSHMSEGPHILRETPATMAHVSSVLSSGGAAAAPDVIATVKKHHPRATKSEIMNFLVTAYCPVVAGRTGLTKARQRQELLHFDRTVERLLYRR
jgi:hypothetical protein